MNTIQQILRQLQDTDAAIAQFEQLIAAQPDDEINQINADAVRKRRNDLSRRLSAELGVTQTDLVHYHVERPADRYPALAIASAIACFQELVTAVFDALRTAPKQRYRPSPENVELSTLEFATALPIGSVVISMSIGNERLIAVKSDLDQTFEKVFDILQTRTPDSLRDIASVVGIAAIAKAHDWAAAATQHGLNTRITIEKDRDSRLQLAVTNRDAMSLKEAIEEKSDQKTDAESIAGELLGIDVERPNTYFHLRTNDGRTIEGKLANSFDVSAEWAVRVQYTAHLLRITTIRYATGEEKLEWILLSLEPVSSAT